MDQNSPEMFVYNLEILQPSLSPVLQQAFVPSVTCCNYNIKETILSSKYYLFDWYDKQAILISAAALHWWWCFYTMTDAYMDDMGAWKLINNAVNGEFHNNATRTDDVLKNVLSIQICTLNFNLTGVLNCGTKLYVVCTTVLRLFYLLFYLCFAFCLIDFMYILCIVLLNVYSFFFLPT